MTISPMTERFAVYGQIELATLDALQEQGVTTIIWNRPDSECPGERAALEPVANALGIALWYNPINSGQMTADAIKLQANALASTDGLVVGYCRSGMRSAMLWALANVGKLSADEILAATARAGFNLEPLRPQIEATG